jgi:hypothetical protein
MHERAISNHFQPMAYAIVEAAGQYYVLGFRSSIDARKVFFGETTDHTFPVWEDIAVANSADGARAILPSGRRCIGTQKHSELWIRAV